jgi:hypothetical protein
MRFIRQPVVIGWFEFPVCKPFSSAASFQTSPVFLNELRKE